MRYLKLENSSSILLLFPLLAFFLSSFSSLPPSFPPSPPSFPPNYVNLYQNHDTAPWKPTRTKSALISPLSSHVCIMIRIEVIYMAASFCCLLISFLLFIFMYSVSLGHIRFRCLNVCFIIFGRSCLF